MKNAFDELISRLDMAAERIIEPEDMSTETSQTKKKEKKEGGVEDRKIYKNYWTILNSVTYV